MLLKVATEGRNPTWQGSQQDTGSWECPPVPSVVLACRVLSIWDKFWCDYDGIRSPSGEAGRCPRPRVGMGRDRQTPKMTLRPPLSSWVRGRGLPIWGAFPAPCPLCLGLPDPLPPRVFGGSLPGPVSVFSGDPRCRARCGPHRPALTFPPCSGGTRASCSSCLLVVCAVTSGTSPASPFIGDKGWRPPQSPVSIMTAGHFLGDAERRMRVDRQ